MTINPTPIRKTSPLTFSSISNVQLQWCLRNGSTKSIDEGMQHSYYGLLCGETCEGVERYLLGNGANDFSDLTEGGTYLVIINDHLHLSWARTPQAEGYWVHLLVIDPLTCGGESPARTEDDGFDDWLFEDDPIVVDALEDWLFADEDEAAKSFADNPGVIRSLLDEMDRHEPKQPHWQGILRCQLKLSVEQHGLDPAWIGWVEAHSMGRAA